jgi:hypothetical protein
MNTLQTFLRLPLPASISILRGFPFAKVNAPICHDQALMSTISLKCVQLSHSDARRFAVESTVTQRAFECKQQSLCHCLQMSNQVSQIKPLQEIEVPLKMTIQSFVRVCRQIKTKM